MREMFAFELLDAEKQKAGRAEARICEVLQVVQGKDHS
jgi:hypothetical protein